MRWREEQVAKWLPRLKRSTRTLWYLPLRPWRQRLCSFDDFYVSVIYVLNQDVVEAGLMCTHHLEGSNREKILNYYFPPQLRRSSVMFLFDISNLLHSIFSS